MKNRKTAFVAVAVINFIMVLAYNLLTPYMSDDLWYDMGVMKPLSELLSQTAEAYMTWGGRSIADFLLRLSFCFPKPVFDIFNSLMFTAFSLLLYKNIDGRKRFDAFIYALTCLMLWLFAVSFDQTILWVSGACNYLWTGVIILAFVTLYRVKLTGLNYANVDSSAEDVKQGDGSPRTEASAVSNGLGVNGIIFATAMFILGLLAGWCNENTSGGAFLLALIYSVLYIKRVVGRKSIPLWAITGLIGCAAGLILMVVAPGNRVRGAERLADEEQTGLLMYVGRLLKINDALVRNFAVIFCILVILTVYLILKGRKAADLKDVFIYTGVAVVTSYALIMTTIPMDRAFFGAGIFLMIALIQAVVLIPKEDVYVGTLKYASVVVMAVFLMMQYLSCGADLYRIKRELAERDEYVASEKAKGYYDLIIPQLRPQWNNRYTYIYNDGNDVGDSADDYGNKIYESYYELNSLRGLPREEWEEWVAKQ